MGKVLDLEGVKFGRLVATNIIKRSNGRTLRLYKCECGNETWSLTHQVNCGKKNSCGCMISLPYGIASRNRVLLDYKISASRRGVSWCIDEETFDKLTQSNCYYCGSPPSSTRKSRSYNGDFVYNGIDRLNNDYGYKIDNVVSCCKICNYAKNDLSLEEFLTWVDNIKKNCPTLNEIHS